MLILEKVGVKKKKKKFEKEDFKPSLNPLGVLCPCSEPWGSQLFQVRKTFDQARGGLLSISHGQDGTLALKLSLGSVSPCGQGTPGCPRTPWQQQQQVTWFCILARSLRQSATFILFRDLFVATQSITLLQSVSDKTLKLLIAHPCLRE